MTGAELLQLRLSAGLTQVEFAEMIGVRQQVYGRWENGIRPVPEVRTALIRWVANPQGPKPQAPQTTRGTRLGPRNPKPCPVPAPPPPPVAPIAAATPTQKPEEILGS